MTAWNLSTAAARLTHGATAACRLPLSAGLLVALLGLSACTVTRTTPTMPCAGDQHCPADGKWQCDVALKRCVPCLGSCEGAPVDAGADAAAADGSSVDAADAATASDAPALDAATGDAATSDAAGDSISSETADSKVAITSCAGRCGQVAGADEDCNCDALCAGFGDCCDDYLAICEPSDAKDADGATLDAAGDVGQTDALPGDTTATAD